MSDRVAALMQALQTAQTDEARQWIAMQFNLDSLSSEVREAVWVAAIPQWFDKTLLDSLLEQPLSETDFSTLTSLSYIEPFPLDGFFDVHESTRKLLLAKLYQDDPQRYRELNHRAATYCQNQNQDELRWRVATLYHQVLADLDGIEVDFYNQASDWWNVGTQLDKIEALIRPMLEEVTARRLSKKIIAYTYHWQGMLDDFYGRPWSAKDYLTQALPLFQQIGSKLGEAACVKSLGQVLAGQEQIDEAIHTLQHAAELYHAIGAVVGEASCFERIAYIYHNQKRYEESLAAYQQAIDIAPNGGTWYHNRADTYIAMEKYDLALQDIERAEKTGCHLEYLQEHRGMIALWQQQPQMAVDLLQSAAQQRPKNGDFQRALALALLANGNAEAFATMETGLKLTYRKKDVENWLEDLDKLVRIYGERAEFTQMSALITDYLTQRFPTSA